MCYKEEGPVSNFLKLGLNARNPVYGISDPIRLRLACTTAGLLTSRPKLKCYLFLSLVLLS